MGIPLLPTHVWSHRSAANTSVTIIACLISVASLFCLDQFETLAYSFRDRAVLSIYLSFWCYSRSVTLVPPPQTRTHAHITNKSVKQYHTKNIITDICIHEYPQHADAYSATQMCTWPNISFLLRKSTKT